MSRTASFTEADGKRAIKIAAKAKEAGLSVRELVIGVKQCRILLKDELDEAANSDQDRKPKEWPSE
ncbi:hypothetical protein JY97_14780 [Alkalispirochaeta odontotermitis]|nr:hypothetical protein JY97_14780 [Alkalispirochaeta odontotermitis]